MKLGWKRLLKLAAILDTADAQHKAKGERTYRQSIFTHACGTPACALGHYVANTRRGDWSMSRTAVLFGGEPLHDFVPVSAEFGISEDEAMRIFSTFGCDNAKTAKQAARYLRKFVKRKQAEATP